MLFKVISIFLALLFILTDVSLADSVSPDSCDVQYPGDIDNNGQIGYEDVDYLIEYLQGGDAPPVLSNADVNGDYCIDPADVYDLQDYLEFGDPVPVECTMVDPPMCPDSCGTQIWGEINGDGWANIGDWVYMITYLFYDGPPPVNQANADFDGNCQLDMMDVIDFMCTFPWEAKPWPGQCNCVWPPNVEDRHCLPGDANGDREINVGDPVHLINYVFKKGDHPVPFLLMSGDANGDFQCNIGDAVFLINYIFKNGDEPILCGNWLYFAGERCVDPDGNNYDPPR